MKSMAFSFYLSIRQYPYSRSINPCLLTFRICFIAWFHMIFNCHLWIGLPPECFLLFLVFMPLIGFLFRKCFLILFGIDRHGFLGVDLDRRLRSYCRETCFCRLEFHFVVIFCVGLIVIVCLMYFEVWKFVDINDLRGWFIRLEFIFC